MKISCSFGAWGTRPASVLSGLLQTAGPGASRIDSRGLAFRCISASQSLERHIVIRDALAEADGLATRWLSQFQLVLVGQKPLNTCGRQYIRSVWFAVLIDQRCLFDEALGSKRNKRQIRARIVKSGLVHVVLDTPEGRTTVVALTVGQYDCQS